MSGRVTSPAVQWAIVTLALVASSSGLVIGAIYRDNALVTAAFRGNDLVTMLLAVPTLAATGPLARRGSLRARLVGLGLLAYMLYNYVFYLFGAAFNPLFLVYVAIVTLSIGGLILGLAELDAAAVHRRFARDARFRRIAVFIAAFAALLGVLWIARCASYLLNGELPADIAATGHPTAVVYACDLTLLVPSLLVAAVLLWQRKAWGAILATMLMVKATSYGLALLAMSAFASAAGIRDAWALVPLWAVLTIGCAVSAAHLLRSVGPARPS